MKLEIQDPYERGFIDGMAKQRDSKVQQMVEGYAKLRELTDEEKWEVFTNLARSPDLRADMIRFADSILRKAQEKC